MEILNKLNDDIKKSMLAKDKDRLSALRDIKSKILLESTSGSGNLNEERIASICLKLHKQRMETYNLYIEQNRLDLAEEEMLQAKVIEDYLPEMMNEAQVIVEINSVIQKMNLSGMKDMGKAMGILSSKLAGKFDGKKLSDLVKGILQKM